MSVMTKQKRSEGEAYAEINKIIVVASALWHGHFSSFFMQLYYFEFHCLLERKGLKKLLDRVDGTIGFVLFCNCFYR